MNGLFTLVLDFGEQFATGGDRYLDLQLVDDDDCLDTSGLVQLAPRQLITATPRALAATYAESASRLDGPDGSPVGAVFVNSNGAVGLGTDAPVTTLHVAAPLPVLTLQDSDSSDTSQVGRLRFTNSSGAETASVGLLGFGGHMRLANNSASGFLFLAAGNADRITMTPTGRIGIGTVSPTSNLEIRGGDNSGPGSTATLRLVDNSGNQMLFDGNEIEGTEGLFLNHNTAQNVVLATGGGNVGIGVFSPASKLHVQGPVQIANTGDQADLLWLSTERSWVFRQQGTGAETALKLESVGGGGNKSFIIQTTLSGGVGIARTPTGNKLEVEGNASKTTAGSWLANSDASIKTNVRTLGNALAVIGKLRPVAFRYTEQYQAKHPSIKDQDYYNYIAQEFREVFPDSVRDSGEDGLLQMDEYPAGVYAVAAIQELHAAVKDQTCQIDDLIERERSHSRRVGELEGQNAELQARLARLEALFAPRTSPESAD